MYWVSMINDKVTHRTANFAKDRSLVITMQTDFCRTECKTSWEPVLNTDCKVEPCYNSWREH